MKQSDSTITSDADRSDTETIGIGLDLFSEHTSSETRRRYLLHLTIYSVLMLLVIWPIFPVVNRIEPYVLGMPFNMFWNVLVLTAVFVNSIALYKFDEGKVFAED